MVKVKINIRWQKERDGIKRGVDADGDEHVNPDLPIHQSVLDVFEIELISQCVSISLESSLDFGALLLTQELGAV